MWTSLKQISVSGASSADDNKIKTLNLKLFVVEDIIGKPPADLCLMWFLNEFLQASFISLITREWKTLLNSWFNREFNSQTSCNKDG